MKIFLSWSGPQSHHLAQVLEDWIPNVFQSVKSFLSSKDIYAGVQWFPKLKKELEGADFGIVCLTRTNLTAQYIMLEGGAIAMKVGDTKLVPVLCDVSEAQLGKNPLTAFNYVHLNREGMQKLVESINDSLADKFNPERLKRLFDHWWPELEAKIKDAIANPDKDAPKKKIDLEDSVEEILHILRSLARDGSSRVFFDLWRNQVVQSAAEQEILQDQLKKIKEKLQAWETPERDQILKIYRKLRDKDRPNDPDPKVPKK